MTRDELFADLIDDAAMFPPGNAAVAEAVRAHRDYRQAWFAPMIGPLVVPDQQLAALSREVGEVDEPLAVSVINTTGAGGLVSLATRSFNNLRVVAVESALRDLDDLAGNAARVVSAANELDESVQVFVEFPDAYGWERAVETVEAAGLLGKIRTGGVEPEMYPSADALAGQLSVLIEADLPFKATAGLHHAWPNESANERGVSLPQHGFLNILLAVEALIEGAGLPAAAGLLRITDHDQLAAVGDWSPDQIARVRRRFRSFGCCGVTDPIDDLTTLALVEKA